MKRFGYAVFACLMFVTPGHAQGASGLFFECDVTSKSRFENWASGKLGIVMRKDGTAIVTDARTL